MPELIRKFPVEHITPKKPIKRLNLEYVVLSDRDTGNIVDLCKVTTISTANMGLLQLLKHQINLAFNPFYDIHLAYTSLRNQHIYDNPPMTRAMYKVVDLNDPYFS